MNDDLISREALKRDLEVTQYNDIDDLLRTEQLIDNAPPVSHGEWIPVSERLPDNETEVLFQYRYGQSMRVGYHIHDSTIYPFGYEDGNETGWYDSEDNFICGSDEVIAWMPKPEPYQAESEEI